MEKEGKPSEVPLEEKRRRIRNLIDDLLNGLKKIQNEEEEEFLDSKWYDIEKLRMEVRFLRTFVLFGNSSLGKDFYERMSNKINKFSVMTQSLLNDEVILEKYNMDGVVPLLLEEMQSYLSLKNDNYVAMTTEEKMFEYLWIDLHDLPNSTSYSDDDFYERMSKQINILRQVFRRLTDFYPILLANKTTTTQYLFPRFQFIARKFLQFYFDIWTGKYKPSYEADEYSSKVSSLLIKIIPLELEVLYISTSKLIKESTSTQLKRFVKQILKASPKILQNYLIHLQGRMVAVNYSQTQSINVMIEFLLIFLTDIPKRFIHPEKLNDMLAHVALLTRKISTLMEESSNMDEANFSAPDLLQEIERMKGDIKKIFLKAPDQFHVDDGFLFMNLLLRHLNDLLISNVYSVMLIKKEIGMVKESLEFLRSSFMKVRQTLDDSSGVVKDCWVRALDVAYEAEHVINSILVRDKALSHLIFSLPSVTDKIKLIVAEVTCLQLEDKNGDGPLDAKSSNEPIESTSSSFVEVTVGHEEDEAKMIDQLLDKHESELDVISIVGMPGLGKTTLANKVYNNTLVASHFKIRAWCTVSQKYNKSKVLREILQQVDNSEENESEDHDLAEKLRRALYDKRYLIVLDDVWDIATGEMLIACFPKFKRGDRVILTSRNSEVGLKLKCHSDLLCLQLLTFGKSWELFEKMVFGKESCPAELLDVGHQIVKKCQGLPLAVVLIAGVIVRGKKEEKDLWLKIQHNLDISANNNLEIMKVMQLSYDHLPYHLKPLLLYFARSRKGKRTPVSKLMQLWMAEGFLDHDIRSKNSLEEVTQSYLDALISSSLIMVDHIKGSHPFFVKIKVCYVHDVVHDFCSVKAKKEKFFTIINPGNRFHVSDFLHHRLTIHIEEGQLHKKCVLFKSKKCSFGSKHLISLKVSGSLLHFRYICHTRHFGLVRVLQLGSILLKDFLMEEIGSLFHLRFLRIHTLNGKAIPESWLNLQNLETLLINTGDSTMVLLPRMLQLSKLKHVKIDMSCFFEEEEDAKKIQSRILKGENSKLTTLSQVNISYSVGTNDALEKFPNLQHLDCTIVEAQHPPTQDDWFPKLDVLNKLESFIAIYCCPELIPQPKKYHFPSSLKELRLYRFTMTPALLSAIVALPQLEILAIIDSDLVKDKWYASEGMYQSLKTLSLRLVNLSEWEVNRGAFPKLEELILDNCYKLTEIPCAFADRETLKSIHLMNMNREVEDSAIEIKKQIIEFAGEDRLQVHLSDVLYEL
ncbi:putative late blight resistance protein homolog R1A-3 [Solanum tuberosum]|uniref:Hero resistance protein n=1 Tax=Solanum tuberosum TaxID=4113 RepID=M1CVN5_SOLTU|nr:PREDICTED: putative late blight resistance protein homolog R1A-3 [Solanum tuberosum]XP_015167644.1 PREDICTED: putative late blight resistance protein homolog R1A-3 [Solanum tuberosum]